MTATVAELPPMPWVSFLAAAGISEVTGWRWRQAGMLKTFEINGRRYISQAEIRRFNQRAAAGEFARGVRGAAATKIRKSTASK